MRSASAGGLAEGTGCNADADAHVLNGHRVSPITRKHDTAYGAVLEAAANLQSPE